MRCGRENIPSNEQRGSTDFGIYGAIATATDAVDGDCEVEMQLPQPYVDPWGLSCSPEKLELRFTAVDKSGNVGVATYPLTVVDTTPISPAIVSANWWCRPLALHWHATLCCKGVSL